MAPKGGKVIKTAMKDKAKKKDAAPPVPETPPLDNKRGAQALMVTTLGKAAPGTDSYNTHQHYKSLSRMDPEKTVLLQKWLADRSCKWIHGYLRTRTSETKETTVAAKGYGTKCDAQDIYLGFVVFHYFVSLCAFTFS